jgi:hypothetical protein
VRGTAATETVKRQNIEQTVLASSISTFLMKYNEKHHNNAKHNEYFAARAASLPPGADCTKKLFDF